MDTFIWIIQIILALVFAYTGWLKAFQFEKAKQILFWVKGMNRKLAGFIGICELLGAIGLIVPWATNIFPILTPIAAICLILIMLQAMVYHVFRKEFGVFAFNAVLTILAAIVAYWRF